MPAAKTNHPNKDQGAKAMLRRTLSSLLLAAACLVVTGCADDVKTVTTHEQTHESEPQMVSPGEPIVE